MESLYDILGISAEATQKEIKSAYKKLALLYHPDRNPHNKDAEEKFKAINNAYHILSDPLKKQQYDSLRKSFYFHHTQSHYYTYQTTYQPHHQQTTTEKQYRSSWTYTAEDRKRDEELARKWMLGFFLVVAAITFMVYGFLAWKDRWEAKKILEKKMLLTEKVEKQNNYEEILPELKKMRETMPNDDDVKVLYQKVI
ncbi:MAG: DnaJ domain-containing protein, partial [Flammeovirgaceae bacterium]|nr:DnaJ domain-containing protein [Flammeovirgaceae bacterium]MDW8287101.1 DnaJ domain-containing protein [Flammeovirgaceae bacterium]